MVFLGIDVSCAMNEVYVSCAQQRQSNEIERRIARIKESNFRNRILTCASTAMRDIATSTSHDGSDRSGMTVQKTSVDVCKGFKRRIVRACKVSRCCQKRESVRVCG